VAEEVVNPLQLHQAADKVQAALLILHAVLPHPVAARQARLHVDPVLLQQRLHNLRHRLALEDAQVAVALHRPQVRLHRQRVDRVAGAAQLLAAHRHPGDFAVEVARAQRVHQAVGRQRKRHRLAQQGVAVDARVSGQQFGGEHKRTGQRLGALKRMEQQAVRRQLCGNA